ncbi:MAG: Fic family protein [Gammaproteobacteria bacterium]|nr:Fic family protein [Gammaproteobacteria bacterium]
MATPQEKLAESLQILEALQKDGIVAVRSADLSRTHRERLVKGGFLQEVMKGWYIPSRPDEDRGESTAWYASFWDFCAAYLNERFGDEWSLSPEQSLFIHAGALSVPQQLLVRAHGARNKTTNLAHGTSIFEVRATIPPAEQTVIKDGLRLFSAPAALVSSGPGIFKQNATEARTVLAMIRDASELLSLLLNGGHTRIAGRLAGAFRNIGRDRIADEILKAMRAAGFDARETDPFEGEDTFKVTGREPSPYVIRMRLSWNAMRQVVMDSFPPAPGRPRDAKAFLERIDEIYVDDAYHSLSIEGYRVSRDLIERVRTGQWDPDGDSGDRSEKDAMAARGYYLAFQAVKRSVGKVLAGENPGDVADHDHGDWYRELFAPSVTAGILEPADLAGYRNDQVYIRRSKHVPPHHESVRDMMPAFFDLLRQEADPAVRVVLGHFMFVYIHPYMDGNGRTGRFLMNLMLSAGGYSWTVIPVNRRSDYMAALEAASVNGDIKPFVEFLAGLLTES